MNRVFSIFKNNMHIKNILGIEKENIILKKS